MANPNRIFEFSRFGLECSVSTEEIPALTTWKMNLPMHTFILHLSGNIDHLETEMDGKGAFYDPPDPGHLTVIPAGCDYQTFAQGGLVEYAVFHLPAVNKESPVAKPREMASCICYLDGRFLKLLEELYCARANAGMDVLAEEEVSIKVLEHIQAQPWKGNSAPRSTDGAKYPCLSNPQRKLLRELF